MTSGPVVQLCLEKVQRAVRPVFSRREDDLDWLRANGRNNLRILVVPHTFASNLRWLKVRFSQCDWQKNIHAYGLGNHADGLGINDPASRNLEVQHVRYRLQDMHVV